MTTALTVITERLTGKEITKQLVVALDLDPADEAAQREAFKYASSVISEISKTQGNQYGDLTLCSPDSICRAVVDAAQFKVQIDGRKLAHLESRWDKNQKCNIATLQIDTNGFVGKIKEHYPDAEFKIQPVYKGDTVSITTNAGVQSFEHKSENPFGKLADLEGIIVQISYTNGGRMTSDVSTISIEELRVIRSKGKGKAWEDFPIERMKTAALKRAAKWHFRQNATIQDIIDYDNKQFVMDKPDATDVRPTIIDNINESVKPKVEEEIEEAELVEDESEIEMGDYDALKEAGDEAADEGVAAYKEWLASLDEETEKPLIKKHHKAWTKTAKEADPA